jgi:replicative DNA helicase
MSVAEIAPRDEEFERIPPHDLAAEQCVLGGMLMSKDAISDVLEVLRPQDHYRPAHQIVHEVILDLYSRGEPADAVTVANELTKRKEIARVGGAPYLHTLMASVPTAANAGYYARIVRERAILRRLVEAGTRIVQLGYSGDGDADDIVDRAEAEVYGVTDRRVSEDFLPLSEIMPGALNEIEAIGSRGGALTGVPTGFADLDALTNGLHPGQMVVIAARPALGKALDLQSPLPTPSGWTTMGEVRVGDWLLGADGKPTRVMAATDVLEGRPCYEVEFDDGTVIVADAQHQWRTNTRVVHMAEESKNASATAVHNPIVTTEQIAATLRVGGDVRPSHSVATARPLRLPDADLPLPPYILGGWLGNGSSSSADCRESHGYVTAILRSLRVLGNKHIPAGYLRASEPQRRALLAGLLDTNGAVSQSGSVHFAVTSRRLADNVRELLHSLGYRCGRGQKRVAGRTPGSSVAYTVTFTTSDDVFWLERKRAMHRQLRPQSMTARTRQRFITDVRPVPSVPVRCVQVDNPDQMYLAGRAMIPTHNSTLALDLARAAAVRAGLTSVIFSLEMSRNEITMRLLSAEAQVQLQAMRTGHLSEDDWARLARRMSEVVDAPLFIDDSPNMSMMEIRAKCRRLKQRHDLRLVIIDYLQLMTSPKRVENRQQEVSEMSRSLKLLAKELDVPVVAVAQLNRGPEQRSDKRPLLADLRESGCLTEGTHILRADTGSEVTLGELIRSGERDIPVWSLDDRLRLVSRIMARAFPSGVKEVYRVRLRSGREVEATANHPFLTYDGWRPLGELRLGSRVAVPRSVPDPISLTDRPDAEIILLGHMIGDGSFRSHEKFVPREIFSLPSPKLALFLRHLWATGGFVWWDTEAGRARIHYASASRPLVDDVAQLLLRFNVMTRLEEVRKANSRSGYRLHIYGPENQLRFLDAIGVRGERGAMAAVCRQMLRQLRVDSNLDTVPREVWASVRRILQEREISHREFSASPGMQSCGSALRERSPSGQRLARVAAKLEDSDLEMIATNDVFWDEIGSIVSLGEQRVYDATVPGTSNFIANGISLHNSIEQDSDVVILLHREDAYEPESPRAGEADFIVAKHRNGPTATVTVTFQGHYSRFMDMARV